MAMNQKTSFIIEDTEKLLARIRTSSRQRRAKMFLNNFALTSETKILDLGGWNGVHIHAVLKNSPVQPANVYIADIDEQGVKQAAENFGFIPIVIPETGPLPFPDKFFDIVFCSSVIEHVTVPKDSVWTMVSGRIFREEAQRHQSEFAREIIRLGNGYFVQAPYRWFPIETHSWLPFSVICRVVFRFHCYALPIAIGSSKRVRIFIYQLQAICNAIFQMRISLKNVCWV